VAVGTSGRDRLQCGYRASSDLSALTVSVVERRDEAGLRAGFFTCGRGSAARRLCPGKSAVGLFRKEEGREKKKPVRWGTDRLRASGEEVLL